MCVMYNSIRKVIIFIAFSMGHFLTSSLLSAQDAQTYPVVRPLKELISECAACHSYKKGEDHQFGPNLYGVYGRQLATAEGYDYSQSIKPYTALWETVTLDAFLQKPHRLIPATKMRLKGIESPKEREIIINWLKELGPKEQVDLHKLVDNGDAEKGRVIFQNCKNCHVTEKYRAFTIGPSLHGIVGRKIASYPGFNYSCSLVNTKGYWTPVTLNRFFLERKSFSQGSHRAFKKIHTQQDRANLIAYLKTLK